MTHAPNIPVINTAPIHALFAAMAASVLAYMATGAPLYKKSHRVRRLAQLGRLLLSMERYNRAAHLKASMLACPQWCRRVFYDLGGWHALRRWQERRRSAQWRAVTPLEAYGGHSHAAQAPAVSHNNNTAPRGRKAVKTDERGQFRWAVISRRSALTGACAAAPRGKDYDSRGTRAYDPIEISPADFMTALAGYDGGQFKPAPRQSASAPIHPPPGPHESGAVDNPKPATSGADPPPENTSNK